MAGKTGARREVALRLTGGGKGKGAKVERDHTSFGAQIRLTSGQLLSALRRQCGPADRTKPARQCSAGAVLVRFNSDACLNAGARGRGRVGWPRRNPRALARNRMIAFSETTAHGSRRGRSPISRAATIRAGRAKGRREQAAVRNTQSGRSAATPAAPPWGTVGARPASPLQ